jgi:hypothetical protein
MWGVGRVDGAPRQILVLLVVCITILGLRFRLLAARDGGIETVLDMGMKPVLVNEGALAHQSLFQSELVLVPELSELK